jgi:Tfp pilus assembly protein PilV
MSISTLESIRVRVIKTLSMTRAKGRTGEAGWSLIEVLITALILGISVVGISILLSRGSASIVAQGDTRVALHLAQQKVERFRAFGTGAAQVTAGTYKLNYSDATANSGCANAAANNEPCYNEALSAGAGAQTPPLTQVDSQSFTRLSCVRWVQDNNPELPADPLEPPSLWTCPACVPPVIDPGTGLCTANCSCTLDPTAGPVTCSCTGNTKRVKVAVFPTQALGRGDGSTAAVDPVACAANPNSSSCREPSRATLETVLTSTSKP